MVPISYNRYISSKEVQAQWELQNIQKFKKRGGISLSLLSKGESNSKKKEVHKKGKYKRIMKTGDNFRDLQDIYRNRESYNKRV